MQPVSTCIFTVGTTEFGGPNVLCPIVIYMYMYINMYM